MFKALFHISVLCWGLGIGLEDSAITKVRGSDPNPGDLGSVAASSRHHVVTESSCRPSNGGFNA